MILTFWSVACQSTTTAKVTATSEEPVNSWTTWLFQPVCQPPCWQNITPGITTIGDALSILENTPGLVITYRGQDGLSWNFGTDTAIGNITASEDGRVFSLWMGSSSNPLHLEEVVSAYSFPQYVKPYDCREGMCEIALVYSDLGMLLTIYVEDRGNIITPRFEILPNTIIDRVYFIEPGMENFQKHLSFQDYDLLMYWKRYGEYP